MCCHLKIFHVPDWEQRLCGQRAAEKSVIVINGCWNRKQREYFISAVIRINHRRKWKDGISRYMTILRKRKCLIRRNVPMQSLYGKSFQKFGKGLKTVKNSNKKKICAVFTHIESVRVLIRFCILDKELLIYESIKSA